MFQVRIVGSVLTTKPLFDQRMYTCHYNDSGMSAKYKNSHCVFYFQFSVTVWLSLGRDRSWVNTEALRLQAFLPETL